MSELVVFATDGGKAGAVALRFVVAYAERMAAATEIVSVVEPLSDLPMGLPHRDELEFANAMGVAERVRDQLRDVAGPVAWPIHVRLGRPAPAICAVANERRASLVVLGLDGRTLDASSIAVEVLHLADAPVLVAREPRVPDAAVVGIDFRSSSYQAAREAARVLGPDGTLHLVHVEPFLDFPAASVWDWSGNYGCAVAGAFETLIARLAEDGVDTSDIRTHIRMGDPALELVQAATDLDAGLLAIGSDGYTCRGRVVVGRIARRLLEDPPLPILATPVPPDSEAPVVDLDSARGAVPSGLAERL